MILLKIAALGGPIILAVLGILVTERAPKNRERWVWFGAFGVIAVVATAASIFDSVGTDQRLSQIWEYQTGGDNYVVIRAHDADLKSRRELIRFEISSTGPIPQVRFWIHPASSKGNADNPEYWKFKDKGGMGVFAPLGKSGGLLGNEFPVGSYRIEFDSPNGHFVEYLNIFEFNGELVQTIDIQKGSKVIYNSPRP